MDKFKRLISMVIAVTLIFQMSYGILSFVEATSNTPISWASEDFIINDNILEGLSETGKIKLESTKELTIPEIIGVDSIADRAFESLGIVALDISPSIKVIGSYAFANNSIQKVSMTGIETVGNHAFENNYIISINNLDDLTSVGDGAFIGNPEIVILKGAVQDPPVVINTETTGAVLNPATIKETFTDIATGSSIRSELILNKHPQTNEFFYAGQLITLDAPIISGYIAEPSAISMTVDSDSSKNILNFTYRKVEAPVIIAENQTVFIGENINLIDYAKATDSLGNSLTVTSEPSALDTSKEGETLVTYKATDSQGVTSSKSVTFTVIAPTSNDWLPTDFNYSLKPDGTMKIIGLSASGSAKYEYNKDLVLPYKSPSGILVTEIGGSAFRTSGWTSVDFSKATGIKIIGNNSFENSNFTSIDFSHLKGLEIIGASAFGKVPVEALNFTGCSSLKSIESTAFADSKITSLDLSTCSSLESIGELCFFRNTVLKDVNLSGCANLKTIKAGAFREAPITKLDLSGCTSIELIDNEAFESSKLTSLDLSEAVNLYKIGMEAFRLSPIENLNLSGLSKLKHIGDRAFENTKSVMFDFRDLVSLEYIGNGAFNNAQFTTLDLTNSKNLTTIGHGAFANNKALTTVDLTGLEKLKLIGIVAFGSCSSLKNLSLQGCISLESIEYGAFSGAPLETLDLSHLPSLKTIANYAFNSAKLTSLNLSGNSSLTLIGDSSFSNSPLTDLNLSGCTSLIQIGNAAFSKSKLEYLDLSSLSALERIGNSAFQNAPLNQGVSFPEDSVLKYIGGYSFYAAKMTSLDLSGQSSLEFIGNAAFAYSPLTELNIAGLSNLKTISAWAFRSALLKSIDFSGLTSLENIGTPEGTVTGDGGGIGLVFPESKLTALDLSDSPNLKYIGLNAFLNSTFSEMILNPNVTDLVTGTPPGYIGTATVPVNGQIQKANPLLIARTDGPTSLESYIVKYVYQTINRDTGYIVNPTKIIMHYVDEEGNTIAPDRYIETRGETSYTIYADPIYGYKPKVSEATIDLTGPLMEHTFVYEKALPPEAGLAEYTLSQSGITTYGLIGSDLVTELNFSISGEGEALTGATIELYYEQDRVDAKSIRWGSLPDSVSRVDSSVPGKITVYLKDGVSSGTNFSMPFIWKLTPYVTEKNQEFPLRAQLVNSEKQVLEVANELGLSGYYNNPAIDKGILGGTDGTEVFIGIYNSDRTGYIKYINEYITYTFAVGGLQRNIETVKWTDTLPTYTKLDGTIGTAIFKPELNPGWILSGDGKTVIYEQTGLNTVTPTAPKLVLGFPLADPEATKIVKNKVVTEFTPYNMGINESVMKGSDSISNILRASGQGLTANKHISTPRFDYSSMSAYFYDNMEDKNSTFYWHLLLDGQGIVDSSTSYRNIRYTDHDLDPRMKYTGVMVPENLLGTKVQAFDTDGNVIYETVAGVLSVSPLDSGKKVANIDFPKAVQENIAYVKYKFPSRFSIWSMERVDIQLKSQLRDPSNIHYEELAAEGTTKFYNSATYEVDIYKGESPVFKDVEGTVEDHVSIRSYQKGMGIKKETLLSENISTIVTGDRFDYKISLEPYIDNQSVYYRGDSGMPAQLDEPLENVKIVDLIPLGILVESVELSEGALYGENVKYSIVENYNNTGQTAVIISADRLPPYYGADRKPLYDIATITATADLTLKTGRHTNKVYLDFTNPYVEKSGAITFENPIDNSEELPVGQSDVTFVETKEVISQKNIRNIGGAWTTSIETQPGGLFDYRLIVANNSTGIAGENTIKNINLIDIFPVVGDRVITPNQYGTYAYRGSEFSNTLIGIEGRVIREDGTIVNLTDEFDIEYYYSETPIQINNGIDPDEYYETLSWSSTIDLLNSANLRAVRIIDRDTENPLELGYHDTLEFIMHMKAPEELSNIGKIAFNSFARKDSKQAIYREPNAVSNTIVPPKGEIELIKKDSLFGTLLPGAVFELQDTLGNVVARATSNEEGRLALSDIGMGSYNLVEIKAPEGYKLDSTPIKIEYSDFIQKYDLIEYVKSNAVYELREYNEGSDIPGNLIETKKSASDGKLVFRDIELKKYYLVEISTSDGSEINPNPREISETELKPVRRATVSMENRKEYFIEPIKANLTIHKTNEGTADGRAIYGIGFKIEKLIMKESPAGSNNWILDEANPVNAWNVLTDDLGNIKMYELETGYYRITETETRGNLALANPIIVYLGNDGVAKVTKDSTGNLIRTPYENRVVEISNDIAEVTFMKLGITQRLLQTPFTSLRPTDGIPLANIKVDLFEGDTVPENYISSYTTETSGTVKISKLKIETVYTIVEKEASPDYYFDGQNPPTVSFKVTKDGRIVSPDGTPFISNKVMMANEPLRKTSSITIQKQDTSNKSVLQGIEFTLYKDDGTVFAVGETNTEGLLSFTDIPDGTYTLKETKSISGYVLSPREETITVKRYEEQHFGFTWNNDNLNAQFAKYNFVSKVSTIEEAKAAVEAINSSGKTGIYFLDRDGSYIVGEALVGAEFKVTEKDLDGTVTDSWNIVTDTTGSAEMGKAIHNEDGTYSFQPLNLDKTYTISEIRAPEGYLFDSSEYTFTPKDELGYIHNQEYLTGKFIVGVKNMKLKHKIVINKTDEKNSLPLKDAVFSIKKLDRETLVEIDDMNQIKTTDEMGVAIFNNLEAGLYAIEETNAPSGYANIGGADDGTGTGTTARKRTIIVHFTDDNEPVLTEEEISRIREIGIYAEPFTQIIETSGDAYANVINIPIIMPMTGGIGSAIFVVIGLTLIGVVVLIKRKRDKL